MGYLSIWLFAIGLGDLVADLSGHPRNPRRSQAAVVVATASAVALSLLVSAPMAATLAISAWALLSSAAWIWARSPIAWSSTRVVSTLALAVSVPTATALGASAFDPAPLGGSLSRGIDAMGVEGLAHVGWSHVLLAAACLLVLQATGNAVVRLLLALAGTPDVGENELRGGRLIGPLERTLIFALVLAGSFTGAAVVAGAKGLLRFPELNRESERIHIVTEYLLVGSLSSWLFAFGVALLVIASG